MRTLFAALGFMLLLVGAAHAQAPNQNVASRPFHLLSQSNDNSTLIKAGVSVVTAVVAVNTTGTMYYLKFYNTAVAPTCGTTTVQWTYPVPFGASSSGGGVVVPLPNPGVNFNLGIGICITAGIADSDDTSAAAGVAVDIAYQ